MMHTQGALQRLQPTWVPYPTLPYPTLPYPTHTHKNTHLRNVVLQALQNVRDGAVWCVQHCVVCLSGVFGNVLEMFWKCFGNVRELGVEMSVSVLTMSVMAW